MDIRFLGVMISCLLIGGISVSFELFASDSEDDTTPSLEIGAKVFNRNCMLCHGSQGMGEGKIPLRIESYPDTNLITSKKASTAKEIHDVVVFGGMLEGSSIYSPPFGNELTWTEVESVSKFILHLRNDTENALTLLENHRFVAEESSDLRLGLEVYESRCVLCHGSEGEGDGRMARIIKDPPPFNLTQSKVPAEYVYLIIDKGGEPVGRSPQMPPWGDQLSKEEIDAVTAYVLSMR